MPTYNTTTGAWDAFTPTSVDAIASPSAVPTITAPLASPAPSTTKTAQPTVVSSSTINNDVIPKNTTTLNTLSQKGTTVGADGVARYADGSLVSGQTGYWTNDESGKAVFNPNATGNAPTSVLRQSGGTYTGGDGNQYYNYDATRVGASDFGTGSEDSTINSLLEQMKSTLDANSKAMIDSIHSQYENLRTQQADINNRQNASVGQSLLMAGSSRYAPISSAGIVSAQMTSGLNEIAKLDSQENSAIAAARQAQQDGDFKIMGQQIAEAQKSRQAKMDAAKTLNDALAKQNADVQAQKLQAMKDSNIASIYQSGTTDPLGILKALQAGGDKTTSLKDISESLKNIVPAGVNDLVKTMQMNGAPADLVSKVLSSPDVNTAFKTAGLYANGGTGMIGEYNYAKANGYSGSFNDYQNADANRKAKVASAGVDLTIPASADTGALGTTKSGDILSAAGISLPAFNYLTQGTASMSRMDQATRAKIMNEAQSWATKKGVDISTFQSQYKAYNDVLQKNISRANQTQIMAGEVSGSADSLMQAIDQKDLPKLTSLKALMSVGQDLSLSFNGTVATKYATQLQFMANDLAGYLAAARGATSPELTDMQDAAKIINNGMNKGSVQAFKDSINSNEEKVSGVVQHAVDSTRKQVWGLFGVGDKYTSAPATRTSDQIAAQDKLNQGKVATWVTQSGTNRAAYEQARKIFPNATTDELMQQLGIQP